MLIIMGVRGFSIYGTKKKSSPAPLFVMRTVAAAIIPEGGLAPSLLQGED